MKRNTTRSTTRSTTRTTSTRKTSRLWEEIHGLTPPAKLRDLVGKPSTDPVEGVRLLGDVRDTSHRGTPLCDLVF